MRRLQSAAFKISLLALLKFACSVQKHAIQTNGVNGDVKPQNRLFCLGHVDPIYCTHTMTNPSYHPKRQLGWLTHSYTTKSPLVTMGVVDYSGRCTKRVLDHFWHAHFFKMENITDGSVSKLKLQKLLFLVTK